jgi:hypothetical protein
MSVESAGVFLASTILVGLSIILIIITILFINNLFAKYWKPVKLFTPDSWSAFQPPMQQPAPVFIEPSIEETKMPAKGKEIK